MTKMTLGSDEETKGNVHWIISYDKAEDIYLVECPVTPMDFDENGNAVSGVLWHLTTLTKGSLLHCAEWIRGIAQFDDPTYDPFGE